MMCLRFEKVSENILLAFRAQKNTVPAAIALSAKTVLSVRLQGFEPWTP